MSGWGLMPFGIGGKKIYDHPDLFMKAPQNCPVKI